MERRHGEERDHSNAEGTPSRLTQEVRAARDRRGLLSDAVALESGASVQTVIRVLSDRPALPDLVGAERLSAWAAGVLATPITLNSPTQIDR